MKKNKTLWALLSVTASISLSLHATADPLEDKLFFNAVTSGNLVSLQQTIPRVNVNQKNSAGHTALMIAAKSGNFEVARFLLWSGASADVKDANNKKAIHYLAKANGGFHAFNLLLRTYSFSGQLAKPNGKVKTPHMVVVDDNYLEYSHPSFSGAYYINEKEKNGKLGIDDDKNGFVDDVFGWNIRDNKPLTEPLGSLLHKPEYKDAVKRLVNTYNLQMKQRKNKGDELPMKWSFTNPLTTYAGYDFLKSGGIEINDLKFYKMIIGASHGTHVAGIVYKNSGKKALIHGISSIRAKDYHQGVSSYGLVLTAKKSETYADFYNQVRQYFLKENFLKGKRTSKYLKQLGAGVVNMSYGQTLKQHKVRAKRFKEIYKKYGKNPNTINSYKSPDGMDLTSDLALELMVAEAAGFAITMAENPDVVFVIAAGNENHDNDLSMKSPAYLSRFFPNVITVASIDKNNEMSSFSNRGRKSVQIATHGSRIYSSILGGYYDFMNGTSMAAPKVAGVVARIRAAQPSLSPLDIRRILGQSCTKTDALKYKLVNGGIMDIEAAMKLAGEWGASNQAITQGEISSLGLKADNVERHASAVVEKSPKNLSKNALIVSDISGFTGDWMTISRSMPNVAQQALILPTTNPVPLLKKLWGEGFRINSSGGDDKGWTFGLVKKKKGAAPEQALSVLNQTDISAKMSQGFAITTVAGWGKNWVFTFTKGTGYGKQRYTLPSSFTKERVQWIKGRWKEGYRITGLAGDVSSKTEGSYIFVLTKGSNYGDQIIQGLGPWPTAWIQKNWSTGYRITSTAGFGKNWIVVMSKLPNGPAQNYSRAGRFPMKEIEKGWNKK